MSTPAARPSAPAGDESDRTLLHGADVLVFVEDLTNPRLSDADAHHLFDVLRLREGSLVVAADGAGSFRACRLSSPPRARSPRTADAEDGRILHTEGEIATAAPRRAVAVAFALIKGDRNDWVVQKLTEIGVDRIVPFVAERSVIRLDNASRSRRADRFRRVAREAATQARRPTLPIVTDPVDFADLVPTFTDSALAHFGGSADLAQFRMVVVGPEGGFSELELSCGLARVDLGPTVLRAETAAIVAAARLCEARETSPELR